MPSKSSDARLLAVYVVPLPTLGKLEKAYFSAGSRLLADLAWGASTKHDFKIDTLLETGDARKKTLTAVRGNGADIIVIGSHGAGKIGRLLLGSVSQSVVQNAKIPVLVIK